MARKDHIRTRVNLVMDMFVLPETVAQWQAADAARKYDGSFRRYVDAQAFRNRGGAIRTATFAPLSADEAAQAAAEQYPAVTGEPEPLHNCTNGDPASAMRTLWDLVFRVESGLTQDEVDNVKTAMAWVSEALGINPEDL